MSELLNQLDQVLEDRKQQSADESYVASLYQKGLEKILKKVGEEATETVMAAKDCETDSDKSHLIYEITDLWFHTLILLHHQGLSSNDILKELERRFGLSGHVEKANRSE